ncbi:MAG: CHAD domain-containing protein [Planctomycetia bacterium]|nr:CHAD domain-containing protein [Planctomycetia bacterium]
MSVHSANSKWIEGLAADQPVKAAAQRVLELRLHAVWERLPAAATEANQDPEHVHQLRVSSRRAHAALRLFKACLPRRKAKQIEKLLRRLRQAAGEARDYDVQHGRLLKLESDAGIATKSVIQMVDRRRGEAQAPIVDVYEHLQAKGFPDLIEALLSRLDEQDDEDSKQSFGEYAAKRLRRATTRFFNAEAHGNDAYATLHQFRIRAKELRYTLEVVAPVWGETVRREIYPMIEDLQERLGEIVDSHVAIDLYKQWNRKARCDGSRCALRSLIAYQRTQLVAQRAAFDSHWTLERSANLRSQIQKLVGA